MNLPRLIRKNKLFYNFEDKEINTVFNKLEARIVKYSRGFIIAKQGSPVNEIGIILSGTLIRYIAKSDGQAEASTDLESGEMFGEVEAFLQRKELSFSYVAAEDAAILYITTSSLTSHTAENSPFHQKLITNLLTCLAERIELIHKDTEYLLIKSMRLKIAKLVYDKYLAQDSLDVTLGINRNEMAEYLNVSRPSMSREMQRMRDEGIFEYRKDKIQIRNLPLLESIVKAE